MKILWSVNVVIEEAGAVMGQRAVMQVSWLNRLSRVIRDETELVICYPTNETREMKCADGDRVRFYAIPRKSRNGFRYESGLTACYREILQKERPDVIHIWGTEFPSTLSMVQACEQEQLLEHTVVSIQGMISKLADHFYASLPFPVRHRYAFKNLLRGNNLYWYRRKFVQRGKYEVQALQKLRHAIGRTDWDRAALLSINPKIRYHYNSETLREPFYEGNWKPENCERHRIFMSQSGLPYKGMHYALHALHEIVTQYPDTHLYVTGRNLQPDVTFREALRMDGYERYLQSLIRKYHLEKHVTFLGTLNAEQMKEQYLKANVFILPSAMENSPNALGEAMLLGIPSIASDVGGVKNLMEHGKEGLVYQHDVPYVLAYYVMQVFEEQPEVLMERSKASREHAGRLYDAGKNMRELLEIYREIGNRD